MLQFGAGQIGERCGQLAAVAFQVELEVEPQTSGVPIGGANERPETIHYHEFAVIERRRREPHATAPLQQAVEGDVRIPVLYVVVTVSIGSRLIASGLSVLFRDGIMFS